jgi:predicted dehydrogenase
MLAIIGFGNHVKRNILPALQRINISVKAIVVRDISRYQLDDIARYNITDSLGLILNDIKVTHVYIATPNSTHVDLSIQVLNADKHVLCEKSVSNNCDDIKNIINLANKRNRKFQEMVMFKSHKQFAYIQKLVASLEFDDIKKAKLVFKIPHLNKDNVRYSKDLLGGALLDLGFYPLSAVLSLFPDVELKSTDINNETDYEVDTYGEAVFTKGTMEITCEWGFGFDYENRIELQLADRIFKVERAFTKPADYSSYIEIIESNGEYNKIIIGEDDHFGNIFTDFICDNIVGNSDVSIIRRVQLFERIFKSNIN